MRAGDDGAKLRLRVPIRPATPPVPFGLPNDESEALLDALWEHATRPELAWEHEWREGDTVLWDNRCAMHYRTPIDPTRRRVMHRIQIAGEPVAAPWA